jgi:arsenite methyltransferase
MRPVQALQAKVGALYDSIQPPGEDPMGDFDERDLLRHAEQAGFSKLDLELRVTVENAKRPVPWERYLRISGNPLIPPLGEALDHTLTADEIITFTEHLRPLVESGTGQERRAAAYLTAVKE